MEFCLTGYAVCDRSELSPGEAKEVADCWHVKSAKAHATNRC